MEEKKPFMPPPPKQLTKIPSPPAQKSDAVLQTERPASTMQAQPSKTPEGVFSLPPKSDSVVFPVKPLPVKENSIGNVSAEREVEKKNNVEEKKKSEEAVSVEKKSNGKSKKQRKAFLYWIGFIASIVAVGVFVFLLMKEIL